VARLGLWKRENFPRIQQCGGTHQLRIGGTGEAWIPGVSAITECEVREILPLDDREEVGRCFDGGVSRQVL